MKAKNLLSIRLCCFVFAVILVCVGISLFFVWPIVFRYVVETNFVLTPHNHAYQLWKKFPEAVPIDFYFFNWTNPEDVYKEGVKPRFAQMGPYRFDEMKEKSNVTWNSNGTVTFRHLKYWYFDREKSGNLRDRVTTVNPVALSAVYTARTWSYVMRKGLSFSMPSMSPNIHITRTINEMLFEGYKDPMITMAKALPFLAGTALPNWDRFGWFYTRNGSSDYEGVFNMGTGFKNTSLGKLYSWNYWTQTPYFQDSCAKVNGSAGEFYSPPDKTSISFFSSDLCRTMTLNYVGQSLVDGILGNKYAVEAPMLDNGTLYPENRCFCNGECVPSGLVNVSSCRFGSPSFASLPHFYNADPYYSNLVEGLKPDKTKHEFFMVLEPTTGIPLEVSARLQINLLMQPVAGISMYEKAPRVFVPMLWFEQKAKIPNNEAFMLRLLLNMPVIFATLGVLLVFGGLITCSCLIYKICTMSLCESGEKKSYLLNEQQIPLRIEKHNELKKEKVSK